MNNIGYELIRLSEDTKYLKEITNKLSSIVFDQDKHPYTHTTSYEERPENISVNNRFGGKIEPEKS